MNGSVRSAGADDVAAVERAFALYVPRIGRRPAPMDEDYRRRTREGGVFVWDDDEVKGPARARHRERLRAGRERRRRPARARPRHRARTAGLRGAPRPRPWGEDGRREEEGFARVYFSKSAAIETERLLLRPFRESDLDDLHDIRSRPVRTTVSSYPQDAPILHTGPDAR